MGNSPTDPAHVVCVVGAAVAGSEAARVLADAGVRVIVLERNERPYGKIEDGLPLWHAEQRIREYERIDQRLNHPLITLRCGVSLGEDVQLTSLLEEWQVSAVLLAHGAWRDRLPNLSGIDAYIGKGLVKQNDLVYWFNHHREENYAGPQFDQLDGALIFGGGLASIDVAKIVMLETVNDALAKRGCAMDIVALEKLGVSQALKDRGLSLEELGLRGCTLFYRRRQIDMPLAEMPTDATPERQEKVQHVRSKILSRAMSKYQFSFQERTLPVDTITRAGRLVGMRCVRTEVQEGRAQPIPGSDFEREAPVIVTSLGSIPEPLPGVNQIGEYYDLVDAQTGRVRNVPRTFALGNVVSGKGNIQVSRRHAAQVANTVRSDFLSQQKPLSQKEIESVYRYLNSL